MASITIPSTIGGITIPGTAASGPLGALFGSSYGLSSLQYPRDLGSMKKGHFIQFSIFERKPGAYQLAQQTYDTTNKLLDSTVATEDKINSAKALLGSYGGAVESAFSVVATPNSSVLSKNQDFDTKPEIISLYMPDTVNFQYNSVYSGTSIMGAMEEVANIAAKAGGAFGSIAGGVASIPAMALSGIQSNTGKLALQTQGLAINPKQQLLFEGIDFRTYQLAFTFTPYSRDEAETVKKIIKAFKVAAAPTIVNQMAGMFFVPPKIVKPVFMYNGVENPNISRVAESVIESIDVNYAPNGWAAHDNGAPVQTTLTINFKEIQLIDSKMIDKEGY